MNKATGMVMIEGSFANELEARTMRTNPLFSWVVFVTFYGACMSLEGEIPYCKASLPRSGPLFDIF